MERQIWDTAVIGGGAAGLAAAAMAARSGKSVVVLERGDAPGGRAVSTEERGARMNLGAHALYQDGAAQRVLDGLGIKPSGGRPGTNVMWMFADERYVSTAGLLLGRTLSWAEKRRLIAGMRRIGRLSPDQAAGTSWADCLTSIGMSGRERQVLEALARLGTYAGDAGRIDAGVACIQLRRRIIYPDGGWQAIVAALRERAEAAGAQLLCSANVSRAEQADDGVWTLTYGKDGHRIAARQMIAAADPALLRRLLGSRLPGDYVRKLDALSPVTAACLDVHLRRLPRPDRSFALGLEDRLYLSVHSRWAKLTRDPHHAVVHVMRYGGADAEDPMHTRQLLEQFLDRMQPGWRDCIEHMRFMPKLIVSHALPAPELRGTLDRPPADTGIPGVYAAGDWVGEEGCLLDAALASAETAARLVTDFSNRRG